MKKTLLMALLAGTMAFLSPKSDAQTYYPPLSSKINPFKQPDQLKLLVWDSLSGWIDRKSFCEHVLLEDNTKDITPIPGKFESGNFARQLNINCYGTSGYRIKPDSNFIYDTTNIGKFNIPVYTASVSAPGFGHGVNWLFIADNPNEGDIGKESPLDFSDGVIIEPQTGKIVKPGSSSLPLNSEISIFQTYWNYNQGNVCDTKPFLKFFLKEGKVDSVWHDPKLVLNRNDTTSTSVERLEDVALDFSLSQNYPNPFNPNTSIRYSVPKTSRVSLKVYDMLGREIETLTDSEQTAGEYQTGFNALRFPSGVYF